MDDKCIMENLLLTAKGACDLYMHGTLEASTPDVHRTFNSALNDTLSMQDKIYKQMEQKGWYTTQKAPQQDMAQVKQKYTGQMN